MGKKKKRNNKNRPKNKPPNITRGDRHLTIISLILAAIGLVTLVELFPRLSASATPPLDLSNQLASSRFTVSNDGYTRVTDVVSACFLWNVTEGGFQAHSSLARVVVTPPTMILKPTEGYTVPCMTESMVGTSPPFYLNLKNADLAIVVYHRAWPWPFTFYRTRRLFRFVARVGRNGEVAWDKQPTPESMEHDFDNLIQSRGGTFPPVPPTIQPLTGSSR
jgi:hypothetical protein